MKNFEDFLESKFWEDYHGHKDEFEDHFDNWLSKLDGSEYIDFAEEYATIKVKEVQGNGAIC